MDISKYSLKVIFHAVNAFSLQHRKHWRTKVLLPWRSENGSRGMLATHDDKLLDATGKRGRVQILKVQRDSQSVCVGGLSKFM